MEKIKALRGKELALKLWWELPPNHWERLHNGILVNFITKPSPLVSSNLHMDKDQKKTTREIVDELISLGALKKVSMA
eukprot:10626595-Ditylum_brightwellii.AAC.1